MFFTQIMSVSMCGLLIAYITFSITKKLFHKRIISYLLSGFATIIMYIVMLFKDDFSKISVIAFMIITLIITLALVIGEKRALSSGRHSGIFEEDRGARKYALFTIKQAFKKFRYPFLKDKGILNNLEFQPANDLVNENDPDYVEEVVGKKMTGHFLHWIFIFTWYAFVFGIWFWYFIGYSFYWMFVALIDTFKELYTKEGSKFRFNSVASDIINSEEVSEIKNQTISVISPVDEQTNQKNPDQNSIIEDNPINQTETQKNIDNQKADFNNNQPVTANLQYCNEADNTVSKTTVALIGIIILLVIIMGLLTFIIFSQNKNHKEQNNNIIFFTSESSEEFTEIPTEKDFITTEPKENSEKSAETEPASTIETDKIITEETQINVEPQTTVPVLNTKTNYNNISENKKDIYNVYLDIIYNMDFDVPMKGFLVDINNDNIDELIIPNTYNMEYVLYYYSDSNIYSCKFGSFMALDNFVMYKVIGDNNADYIYYRDNYSYKSKQGYFSLKDMSQLNIFINYPENDGKYSADWTINYNTAESYANGYEPVDTFYGQPSVCHSKLIEAFQYYNYGISEDSQYININGMYYDELVKNLKSENSSNVSKEAEVPSITAYIEEKSFYPHGEGASFILHVSGNYSYYYYEGYYTGGGEIDYMCTSGTTATSDIELTAGSVMSQVRAVITPYNDTGIAGETIDVIYVHSAIQKPEVTSCNYYGRINTHDETLPGYTTSYIVDGDEVSYVRKSLGNGWHITAVNWCVSNGITWYELYDSDDGDYYGWVDEGHIDFY